MYVVHFDTFLMQQKDKSERTHMKNVISLKEKQMQYVFFLKIHIVKQENECNILVMVVFNPVQFVVWI